MDKENIIKNLKSERDFLLKQKYIPRTIQQNLENAVGSDLIKVITGPRRAGKSMLGIQILKNTPDFFYINFDSVEIADIEDKFNFIKENQQYFKNGKTLFLDEIQNIGKFELLVNQLKRNGYNIIMTGSNANLLSQELATHLTGRYVQFEVLPFSYREARLFLPKLSYLEYLKYGGFPEQLKNIGKLNDYISTLVESVIVKDIIVRFNLRNTDDLLKLSDYLINTPAQESTYNKIKNKLNLSSTNTVIDYYSYLSQAYLINKLGVYSPKQSELIKSAFKSYIIDTGVFINNPSKFISNLGYLFENAIFNELLKLGYLPQKDLFQLKNKDKTAVDFYIKTQTEEYLIQTSLSLKDNETREREFYALNKAETYGKKNKKIVLVLKKGEELFSIDGITVLAAEDLYELLANR
jgi:uncharacterized protein